MQIYLFFALYIAIIAIIFAIQNNQPISVSFLFWKSSESSLALVLLITLAAGALISYLVSMPAGIKARLTIRNQRRKLSDLETELEESGNTILKMQQQIFEMEGNQETPDSETTLDSSNASESTAIAPLE